MFEVIDIQIGVKNPLFSYMSEITSKYKNMYNVANFYIRQVMFGVKVKPEDRIKEQKEVFGIIKNQLNVLEKVKNNT